MKNLMVEPGSEAAPERFHMTITAGGPYLVFGHPPLRQQFMLPNRDGEIWYFQAGEKYSTESEPTALCRCGHSGDKPYCDGSHVRADWEMKSMKMLWITSIILMQVTEICANLLSEL